MRTNNPFRKPTSTLGWIGAIVSIVIAVALIASSIVFAYNQSFRDWFIARVSWQYVPMIAVLASFVWFMASHNWVSLNLGAAEKSAPWLFITGGLAATVLGAIACFPVIWESIRYTFRYSWQGMLAFAFGIVILLIAVRYIISRRSAHTTHASDSYVDAEAQPATQF